MEKFKNSHIDKIVGPYSNDENLNAFLNNSEKIKIKEELEKTPKDKELIDFVQKCLDEYLSDFRKNNIYEVEDESIHILPVGGVEKFTEGKKREGAASPRYGSCVIDRVLDDVKFSIILFHELYHLKDFTSINVKSNGALSPRRSGFGVYHKKEEYFNLINETLNNYYCRKFLNEKIKNSSLFNENDINSYDFESPRIKLLNLFEEKSEEIFQKNKDQFNSKEDIKKLFFDADINGNLLPVARLIEKTYGQGSFRKLGEDMKN